MIAIHNHGYYHDSGFVEYIMVKNFLVKLVHFHIKNQNNYYSDGHAVYYHDSE